MRLAICLFCGMPRIQYKPCLYCVLFAKWQATK